MTRGSPLPRILFGSLLVCVAGLAVLLEARAGSIQPAGFLGGMIGLVLAGGCLVRSWDRPGGVGRALCVAALVAATHLLVASSGRGDSALYSFYFLPILAAARLWGLRGSALAGAAVTLLYATFFLRATMDEVMAELLEETVTLNFIALLAGYLVDRIEEEESLRREAERGEIERERLAETGLLAAQVAHEFRNPLQVIAGGAETIVARGWVAPEGRGLLADLLREARRMEGLVGDFLAYGRPVVRIATGVRLAEVLERAAVRETGIAVASEGEAPSIAADAEALERVFGNLLRNAREAGARRVVVRLEGRSGGARVRVSDDGPGIPEEIRREAFRPFRSGRPGGHGLGLAIARRIVEAHGGTIALLPTPAPSARGAEFEIALPEGAP